MCADELLWSMEGKTGGRRKRNWTWCMWGDGNHNTQRETNERNRTAVNWRGKWRERCKLNVSSRSNQISCWGKKKTLKNLNPKCWKLNGRFVENRNEKFSRLQEFLKRNSAYTRADKYYLLLFTCFVLFLKKKFEEQLEQIDLSELRYVRVKGNVREHETACNIEHVHSIIFQVESFFFVLVFFSTGK